MADLVEVVAELTNERFFGERASQEPSVSRQWIEGTKESEAVDCEVELRSLQFGNASESSVPTVLLGYSAEAEFCVSSSEFTSVAVRPALVNLLVLAGIATVRAQRLPASQRVILRLRSNWTRRLPVRPGITRPDVRTDDAVRRL